jgi:hypothetical protein
VEISLKDVAVILLAMVGCASFPAAAQASTSTDVHAYCRTHPHSAGPGEEADVPRMVRAANADHWRCKDGKVMVCFGGASGRACLRSDPMDDRRLAAFRQFCRANPGSNIPYALTTGLATPDWRCVGARPVASRPVPVDRDGYQTDYIGILNTSPAVGLFGRGHPAGHWWWGDRG